jgi:Copper amine oxidase N-terminal domain.
MECSFALTKEGKVYAWGKGIYEQTAVKPESKNPIEISITEQGYAKSIKGLSGGLLIQTNNNKYYAFQYSKEDKSFKATELEALAGHEFSGIYSGWGALILFEKNKFYSFDDTGLTEIGNDKDVYFETTGYGIAQKFIVSRTIRVIINGSQLYSETKPKITNDRCLVPMRAVFEALGASIEWDDATQLITAVKGDKSIRLAVDSTDAYVNGDHKILDTPAVIMEERTFVPLRFIAESLGA